MLRKVFSLLISSSLFAAVAFGQVNNKVPDAKETPDKLQRQIDSIAAIASVNRITDSLKVDAWSDSLRSKVNFNYGPKRISLQVDSMTSRGIPLGKINSFRDSISWKNEALLTEVNNRQASLQQKLKNRYDRWFNKTQGKSILHSAGLKSPSTPSDVPGLPNQPRFGLPQGPGLAIPSLNSADFSDLPLSPDLKQVAGDYAFPSTDQLDAMKVQVPNAGDLTSPYSSQLGELKSGLKDPGKTAEDRVGQLASVDEINKQAGAVNELTNNEAMQAADQLKGADSPEAILPAAVDHFAGKGVVLQQAMDQMAKYKEKYPSLPSIADVKKTWWPHNSLKGVPFRDRFRLGINLSVKNTKDTLFLDWHPNASYRISGRFEAGFGLMYRLRVQTNHFGFDQNHPVWGTTMFVVAKTFKSLFFRIEMDGTSFPKSSASDLSTTRDWRWSFLSGVQTNFKISMQWMGNVQMMYNFDSSLKDKFPEQLVVRVGVQYKLKPLKK